MLNYQDFDAILFDMDGTIFDSESVHREAWKMTAKEFNQTFTDDMYLQFIGMTTPNCMKVAMTMFNHQVELNAFSDSYYKNLSQLLESPVPIKRGFMDYLAQAKSLERPLGIVTSSGMSGVEANFAHYDFYQDFDIVITRDDVSRYKPFPDPYLLACEKLKVDPKRTIVFEDSNTGATAAIDAGCFTVGIEDLVAFDESTRSRLQLMAQSFEVLL